MKSKALKRHLARLAAQVAGLGGDMELLRYTATFQRELTFQMALQMGMDPDSKLAHPGGFPSLGENAPPPAWGEHTLIQKVDRMWACLSGDREKGAFG